MRSPRLHATHDGPFERRGDARHPAVENSSQVAWYEDQRTCATAAQLMDVSRDGLLVLVDDEPPRGVPVRVRILSPTRTDYVETELVESRRTKHGPYQLRLAFRDEPSGDFLNAAIDRSRTEPWE